MAGPQAAVARSIVKNNRKQWIAEAGSLLRPAVVFPTARSLRRAGTFTSGFILPFPANVNKCVVGACTSRGNQPITFGVDIGGRVAVIHPQQMGTGRADSTFRQLCQPILGQRHARVPQALVPSRAAACTGAAGAPLLSFSSLVRRSSNPLVAS